MSDLIGRAEEREMLEYCESSDKSELVCVYGRRRVGKTFLVEQVLAPYFAFHVVGSKNVPTSALLRDFCLELGERGDPNPEPPSSWQEAFRRMYKVITSPDAPRSPHGKAVVFIDEFPWFARQRSEFVSAFATFWNRHCSWGQKLLVVICGSATSWIIDNLLSSDDDLAARITEEIFLKPFTLAETETYLNDRGFGWSRETIVEAHMVFGGLPFFFSLMHRNQSLWGNIDRLCLAPRAKLRSETMILLESTMRKSKVYVELFALLSQYKYGMSKSEVFETLGCSLSQFEKAINETVKCGYVREYRCLSKKGHPKYLMLVDPFILFHYHVIDPAHGDPIRRWSEFVKDEGYYYNWRGNAFEIICLYHIEQLKRALGISGISTKEYPWASERVEGGAQVDLVIERGDRTINLCEMKFTEKPLELTKSFELDLINKRDVFKEETGTRSALMMVVVSVNGMRGSRDGVIARKLTVDDLF